MLEANVSVVDQMAAERVKVSKDQSEKIDYIEGRVKALKDRLYMELFGLPPFDVSKNCQGGFTPTSQP